jgi:hypothetical protein
MWRLLRAPRRHKDIRPQSWCVACSAAAAGKSALVALPLLTARTQVRVKANAERSASRLRL